MGVRNQELTLSLVVRERRVALVARADDYRHLDPDNHARRSGAHGIDVQTSAQIAVLRPENQVG
jgi:hypothetical protein